MTRFLGLAEFCSLAEQVTGLDTTTLVKASRVELADSALRTPQAGLSQAQRTATVRFDSIVGASGAQGAFHADTRPTSAWPIG